MVNHVMEQSYHGTLISCADILQPKRHNLAAESASLYDEGCFLHIFRRHLILIITREPVHEIEYLMLSGVVNQNINMRKRKVIFGAFLIQIPVVYTHVHLIVHLRYPHQIRNPLRIGRNS